VEGKADGRIPGGADQVIVTYGTAEFPGLQQYAGKKVDTGPKAKAYANEFIDTHLAAVADGKTVGRVVFIS